MSALRFGVQLIGALVLGTLGWAWLGIPDAQIWQLGISIVVGLVMGALWCWLTSFGLGGGLAGMKWAAPGFVALALLALSGFLLAPGGKLIAFRVAVGLILIFFLLPSAAARRWKLLLEWRVFPLLLVLTIIPVALSSWVPVFESPSMQLASFIVRNGLAFVIGVGAWTMILDLIRKQAAPPMDSTPLPLVAQ